MAVRRHSFGEDYGSTEKSQDPVDPWHAQVA